MNEADGKNGENYRSPFLGQSGDSVENGSESDASTALAVDARSQPPLTADGPQANDHDSSMVSMNKLMVCDEFDMISPSAESTIYSLDSATKELLKLTCANIGDSSPSSTVSCCGQCDKCQKFADRELDSRARTFTISRLTYNLSEFDATFRDGFESGPGYPRRCWPNTSGKTTKNIFLSMLYRYIPIVAWLQTYNWSRDINSDVFVGITIAVFQIPQCMGYSLLAKVPPIYGLYSSFLAPTLYAIFGTSKHVSVGTFAIISLMTGSIISDLSSSESFVPGQSEIEIATIIALLIGIYQILFALGRFGFLAQFMSEQLTSGFITASAFYVFSSQLGYITGIQHLKSSGTGAFALIQFYANFFSKVKSETNLATLAISMVCISILAFYKFYLVELFRRSEKSYIRALVNLPFELILVIVFILISWNFDLQQKYGVKILGSVPVGLPTFTDLDYSMIWRERLWLSCIPLAIIAFAVTYSTGVTFANKHGYEVVANQELLALGITNTVCAYFRCIPTAASLSRSALQESIGARSQLTAIINSFCILIVLLFLSPLLSHLPICVLASIICVALKSLFMKAADFKKYYQLDKIDSSIWIVSFLAVLIFNVDLGLYIGLAYSLATLIGKSQRPKTYLLGIIGRTNVYVPIVHYPKARELDNIKIFQFCGPLHFANVDYFKKKLVVKTKIKIKSNKIRHRMPYAIIIDCSMFSYIDATGIRALRNMVNQYEMVGVRVLLAGVATHVARMMAADQDFHNDVPTSKIYITVHDAVHMILEDLKQEAANLLQEDEPKSGTPENPFCVVEVCDDTKQEVTPKVKKKMLTAGDSWSRDSKENESEMLLNEDLDRKCDQ